jgi:hypothetical protein
MHHIAVCCGFSVKAQKKDRNISRLKDAFKARVAHH